jgi:hypothetical protein
MKLSGAVVRVYWNVLLGEQPLSYREETSDTLAVPRYQIVDTIFKQMDCCFGT